MQQGIKISDEEIRYAEHLLLPEGKTFGPSTEPITFIRNFDTIDLQAVPGAGKTTALLAKLVILERKLPFADGSGVLVLSHTNAAVNEIKEKIQKYCPKLFAYPNFIGTVQSFVDTFLAIPCYVTMYKKKPIRIDNEIYNEKIKNCIDRLWLCKYGLSKETNTKVMHIKNNDQALFYNYRFQLSSGDTHLVRELNGDALEIKKPTGRTSLQKYQDYTSQEKKEVYDWFFAFKKSILKSGVLHFDDAYFLADCYSSKTPAIKTILQKRFKYVFVDEMQDLDTHQCCLLERIFYDDGNSLSKIQRIGDRNQAIYGAASRVKEEAVWKLRTEPERVLNLTGSQRLSKPIAEVVKKFALDNDHGFDIVGLNSSTIKPHILVFNDNTMGNIIPCFAQIVRENNLVNSEKPIKVICWNTEWKDDDKSRMDPKKIRLEDYHKGFKREKSSPNQDYDNLKSYLLYYEKKQTLAPIRKNILNTFLKILRLEGVNATDGRPYTRRKLIDCIRTKHIANYENLNLNLYNWSIGLIRGETDSVWSNIKAYVPTLLGFFDKAISASDDFINQDESEPVGNDVETPKLTNYYRDDDLEIEITSVHAVKGQTHCATLYLESYFQQDGRGANAKSYESQRLKDQFLGTQIRSTVGKRVKQSTKMAYVGFSRPTDLLCVAIHQDRFDMLRDAISADNWEVREVN